MAFDCVPLEVNSQDCSIVLSIANLSSVNTSYSHIYYLTLWNAKVTVYKMHTVTCESVQISSRDKLCIRIGNSWDGFVRTVVISNIENKLSTQIDLQCDVTLNEHVPYWILRWILPKNDDNVTLCFFLESSVSLNWCLYQNPVSCSSSFEFSSLRVHLLFVGLVRDSIVFLLYS